MATLAGWLGALFYPLSSFNISLFDSHSAYGVFAFCNFWQEKNNAQAAASVKQNSPHSFNYNALHTFRDVRSEVCWTWHTTCKANGTRHVIVER
jgi:hypothetical protein